MNPPGHGRSAGLTFLAFLFSQTFLEMFHRFLGKNLRLIFQTSSDFKTFRGYFALFWSWLFNSRSSSTALSARVARGGRRLKRGERCCRQKLMVLRKKSFLLLLQYYCYILYAVDILFFLSFVRLVAS